MFIDDWKIPTEAEIAAALLETAEFGKEKAAKEPSLTNHTGRGNPRTRRNRSAKKELYADDTGETSRHFQVRQTGALSAEIFNDNQPVVGYLDALEREIITDKTADEVQEKLIENIAKLF